MSNDYFNNTRSLFTNTIAKATDVEAKFDAVGVGFDLLPSVAALSAGLLNFVEDTGAADAYVVAMSPTITEYTDGLRVTMRVTNANTGECTLNVDSLGAKNINLPDGRDPVAGNLGAAEIVELVYDGDKDVFVMITGRTLVAINDIADATFVTLRGDTVDLSTRMIINGRIETLSILDGGFSKTLEITSGGNVAIGGHSTITQKLDVAGKMAIANVRTSLADKTSLILGVNVDNLVETEGWLMYGGHAASAAHTLFVGGGNTDHNAATAIKFFTAANVTTRTGDERMIITSDGKIGAGITAPDSLLHIHNASAGTIDAYTDAALTVESDEHVAIQFLTPATKKQAINFGDPDGPIKALFYYNHADDDFNFLIDGTMNFKITDVGIESAGSVKVANDSTTASSDNVGALRYRQDGLNSYCEMCMQTDLTTYEWVVIKSNTWTP